MKKSLLALAALSAFASVASAQSSVTLFGIVDLAATMIDNGGAKNTKSLAQDGLNSSRLGLRGIEDLGGGLRAGFWLEGAVGADTGCGGAGTLGTPLTVGAVSTTSNQAPTSTAPGVQVSGGGNVVTPPQTTTITGGNTITQPATTPLGTAAAAQSVSVTPPSQTCIGQNWQRRSTVSLLGAFGEVRLGRDYTPTFWNLTVFDPFGTNGVGQATNIQSTLSSGVTTAVRASNSIGYFLPTLFGGLYGQAMVAAGELTGRTNTATGNKYYGGRIGYAAGPINVAVAYGVTDQTGSMVDEFTNVNVGASYNFGFLTVQGYVAKYEYSIREQKQALIGVLVPLGPGTLRASYGRTAGNAGTASTNNIYKASQYAVGYVYDLSKRTAVYATYAYLNNAGGGPRGGANFAIYGANGASQAGFLTGETSKGGQVGVRHSF